MIKVVLFDLDDTLISEYDYIKSGFSYVSNLLSKKFNSDGSEIFWNLMNLFEKDSKNVFNRLFELYKIEYSHEDIMKLVQEYRNHTPRITYYKDVLPTISNLKSKDIRVGIITDGFKNAQRLKIEALKAYNIFDKIIITDELGKEYYKPSPKTFEIMKDFFNVEYEEMMYVGDNPEKDFYIGTIYPITTVRIMRDHAVYANSKYLNNYKENKRINNLGNLI